MSKEKKAVLIKGDERSEILRMVNIPKRYKRTAIVRRNNDGTINVYYGCINVGDNHGHVVINAEGAMIYHRPPFGRHGSRNFQKVYR